MKRFCQKSVPFDLCLTTLLSASLLFLSSSSLAATKYWIGTGNGTFSDNLRWSTTSGGDNDTGAPVADDDVVFDDGGAGVCSIDTDISVKGLKLESGYSGTLTQGAAITVGTGGYSQSGGTFVGGADDMSVYRFRLLGGSFTAPEATMMVTNNQVGTPDNIFTWDGGTFNHNNGTLHFKSWVGAMNKVYHNIVPSAGPLSLCNLKFSGGDRLYPHHLYFTYQLSPEGLVQVAGDLTIEGSFYEDILMPFWIRGGTIELQGNLTVTEGLLGGTNTLKLVGDANQSYSITGGQLVDTVIVDKESGSVTPALDSVDFPTKVFALERGAFTAPNGLFSASNSFTQADGTFTPGSGDMHVGSFALSGGSFTAPAGTMMLVNGMTGTANIFTWDGGSFNHNDGTLFFNSWVGAYNKVYHNITPSAGPLSLCNLMFSGGDWRYPQNLYFTYQLSSECLVRVAGDLTIEGPFYEDKLMPFWINGGTIELQGNLTVKEGPLGGNAVFTFTGSNDQSLAQSGGTLPTNPWTLDKTGGRVSLATDFTLSGKTQDIHWLSGELNLNTNVLIVGRNVVVTEAGPSALGVSVAADAAGCLIVSNNFTRIDKLDLNVEVRATASELKDKTYQILTNKALLGSEFKSVNWPTPWKGKVNYSENDGKEVWLFDFDKTGGTIIQLR